MDFENHRSCKQLIKDIVDTFGWNIAKCNVLLLLLAKLLPAIIPKFHFQPFYDLKKRLNGNIKKLIQQRKSIENKANRDGEDVTFMGYEREMVDIKDSEYIESQEMDDIILLFLDETDTTSVSTKWGLLLLSTQPEIQ